VTPAQYLDFERESETKNEYVEGEIFELTRPAPAHGVIVGNVAFKLDYRSQAHGCRIFTNNLRVSVQRGELITYPDVVFIRGDPHWFDHERDTLTNPGFIVEVLSTPGKDYDRATARGYFYRTLSSMSEYLVIDSKPVYIEHWRRLPNGNWELAIIHDRNATLRLESLNCEVRAAAIYEDVERYS
jgi:Uma2 family endonuclease